MTTTPTTTTKPHDHPPTDPAPAHGPTPAQIETCAHAAHEAMYAYGRALRHNNISHFEDSPDWQKEFARDLVKTIAGGKKIDTHDPKLSKLERTKRLIAAAVIPPVLDAITAED